mmetsp:Transcript_35948/g.49903  ORF Transcript_35948/g.49903 Transcript_35948/m.49903 type:complete len:206 (-) Transcript_35948:672-1289(-)
MVFCSAGFSPTATTLEARAGMFSTRSGRKPPSAGKKSTASAVALQPSRVFKLAPFTLAHCASTSSLVFPAAIWRKNSRVLVSEGLDLNSREPAIRGAHSCQGPSCIPTTKSPSSSTTLISSSTTTRPATGSCKPRSYSGKETGPLCSFAFCRSESNACTSKVGGVPLYFLKGTCPPDSGSSIMVWSRCELGKWYPSAPTTSHAPG